MERHMLHGKDRTFAPMTPMKAGQVEGAVRATKRLIGGESGSFDQDKPGILPSNPSRVSKSSK